MPGTKDMTGKRGHGIANSHSLPQPPVALSIASALVAMAAFAPVEGFAQTGSGEAADSAPIEEILVSATRVRRSLADVPRSVTILSAAELSEQLDVVPDFGSLLGQLVPGMGTSIQGLINASGQDQIRGRRLQMVVDGIVINNGFLDFREEFQTIDPGNIERIEVIRGGTAVYGFGAAGGIIAIDTRSAAGGEPEFTSQVRTNFQPTDVSDSFGYNLSQRASFSVDKLDVNLFGAYRRTSNRFDGEGDRIPSDFTEDDTNQHSLAGSLRYNIREGQHLEASASYYKLKEYEKWLSVGGSATDGIKADTVEVGVGINDLDVADRIDRAPAEARESELYRAAYVNADVLGSTLQLSGYHQRRYSPTDTLLFNTGVPIEERPLGRNEPVMKRSGTRIDFDTPIGDLLMGDGTLVWGFDFDHTTYRQPNTAGIQDNTPPLEADSYALFLQLDVGLTDRLHFTGGVRYEDVEVSFDDFVVAEVFSNRGNFVQGGDVGFDEFVFNAGLVYDLAPQHHVFASYSQGFTTGEILRAIRNTAASSVETAAELKAQIIHNYEIGVRGSRRSLRYSLAGFFSESSLGVTFGLDPNTDLSTVIRAPEELWGIEATLDYEPNARSAFGGTFSWQEGEAQADDGSWDPLPNNRISPIKITAYAEYRPAEWLRLRANALYSGSRNEFPGSTAFAEAAVSDLFLLDLTARMELPRGELALGVANAFDKQYIPPPLEGLNNNLRYFAAPGRMITATYRITW